ncbi:MAG: hypothetical protein QW354_02320 [Desulfurococcaceae archaeon]
MRYDFLRHIVNPILNKYIEMGISAKLIGDLKKMFQQAEDIYKFSPYNGSINNLTEFLRSKDFANIVNICKTNNLLNVLIEVLEDAKAKYSDIENIVNTIDSVLRDIKGNVDLVNRQQSASLKDFLSEKLSPLKVRSSKRGLRLTLRGNIVVRARYMGDNVDVEISMKKSVPIRNMWKIIEMVKAIEKEANSI